MLRSRLYQNRRQLQAIAAASCVAVSLFLDNNHSENREADDSRPVHPKDRRILSGLSLPPAHISYCHGAFASGGFTLKRQKTVEVLLKTANHEKTVDSVYEIFWENPIGVGTFGNVYQGINRKTKTPVAIKKISKRFTNDTTFQREMDVLLHLERTGGHPSICLMHEHFDEEDYYYLVFDLIEGGELFDQLCRYGAYSEADAARTIRQAASALAFLHGVGVVHSDLKPENLMLSSKFKEDSTIKIVDFGCSHLIAEHAMTEDRHEHRGTGLTPAYCPPEVLSQVKANPKKHADIEPAFDMWSLGVIMYIMLTGAHPFDLEGGTSSATMEENILSEDKLPIRDHPRTRHLSEDALRLLEGLMERDPKKRLTAAQMLETDWILGKTASSKIIKGSDSRLAEYRRHQTKVGSSIFKGLLNQADKHGGSEFAKRTSILEMAFRDLDPKQRGYISTKELAGVTSFFAPDAKLSLSDVQQLLSDNMVSNYFKSGETIYEEGEKGDSMYFLHSGSVEVTSKDGFRVVRKAGEFFGEEALIRDAQNHEQTVQCLTPVHAFEISRDYFLKYLEADPDVGIHMAETERIRQRERAKILFGLQKDLKPATFKKGDVIFREQQQGDNLYILDKGKVDVTVGGRKVRSLRDSEMTGEHAAFYEKKPYNVTATCRSSECILQVLDGKRIRKLCERNKELSDSFKDIILRRDFKKAVVKATNQDFPQGDKQLRHIFNLIDTEKNGEIHFDTLKHFVIQWDPDYTDDDIRAMLKSLDLGNTGVVKWDEFKRVFSMFNES